MFYDKLCEIHFSPLLLFAVNFPSNIYFKLGDFRPSGWIIETPLEDGNYIKKEKTQLY